MYRRFSRRAVLLGIPAVFVASSVAAGLFSHQMPDDLDLSLERRTDAGRYVASMAPVGQAVSVGRMHSWTIALTDSAGKPVEAASIGVDGGMPQHGHGLPTSPAVTDAPGAGRFLIEGMKFNMPGWWEIKLSIDGPAGADTITFNLVL